MFHWSRKSRKVTQGHAGLWLPDDASAQPHRDVGWPEWGIRTRERGGREGGNSGLVDFELEPWAGGLGVLFPVGDDDRVNDLHVRLSGSYFHSTKFTFRFSEVETWTLTGSDS